MPHVEEATNPRIELSVTKKREFGVEVIGETEDGNQRKEAWDKSGEERRNQE